MSDTQDAEARFNFIMKIAAVAAVVLTGYYIWSFFVSSRYEYMFWDMAYKQEAWPL